MNTPVKFELAKLLEEQGYPFEFITVGELKEVPLNIPTIAEVVVWLYEYVGTFGWKKGETNIQSYNFINNHPNVDLSNENWYMCSAPTIAEVVMWLYEKHNIWISVDPENDKDTWFHTISYNKSETIFGNYNTYNSSTEAYEAAIEYTLNNLL